MIPNMIERLHAVYRTEYVDEEGIDQSEYRINPIRAFNHRGEPMIFDRVRGRLHVAGTEPLDDDERLVGVWIIDPAEVIGEAGDGESA